MAESKYLTFVLDPESYGIPILKVKEIIGMMEITHIPRMPDFVKGVINLRGKIIPVMDLRIKFGLEQEIYNSRTCIVVVEVEQNGIIRQNGLVVDTVSEVLSIDDKSIEEPPRYGSDKSQGFLTGMGKIKDKVIMILDTDKIFSDEDIELIRDMNESVAV